jgi:putative transcriptional regulator
VKDVTISNRLRELRARYRITQEGLARMVGVTRQTIIAIENGKYLPPLRLAFKLAKAFNVGIEDIFSYRDGDP